MSKTQDTETITAYPHARLSIENARYLAETGLIPQGLWRETLGLVRDAQAWRAWSLRMIIALGVLHFLAGIIFFFAYNWADLPKMAKFGLLFSGVVGSTCVWLFSGLDSKVGQSSGIAATVLTGVLMAVFGQVYQTGADAYELFLAWALLTLPWTVMSKNPAHILVWLVIAQVAYGFYAAQVIVPLWSISFINTSLLNTAGFFLIGEAIRQASKWQPYLSRWWLQSSVTVAICLLIGTAGWAAVFSVNNTADATAKNYIDLLLVITLQALLMIYFWRAMFTTLGTTFALAAIVSTATLYVLSVISNIEGLGQTTSLLLMACVIALASALFIHFARRITSTMRKEKTS